MPGDYLSISYKDCIKSQQNEIVNHCHLKTLPFAASSLYNVQIVSAEKLTTGEDVKDVYDLTLDVEDIQYDFEPGDTVGILPCNDTLEVDQLLHRLNLTSVANQQYTLTIIPNTTKKKAAVPSHIPTSGTLHEVFRKRLDIRSIPKKLFLRLLIKYTDNQDEVEMLENLCSPSGSQKYNELVNKNRTLLSLLEILASCYPPVEILLENLPPLQPRPYSISSSPLCDTSRRRLHITFAVIKLDEETKGVCTGWLENCTRDDLETRINNLNINYSKSTIPLYFRKSNNFRLPTIPTSPIVMIGPGTGVAPFVGFLEHRFLQPDVEFGTSWLFYGCRYDRDFLYKSKITKFKESGKLSELFVCFSRESSKKQYVQELIVENRNEFVDLIMQQNAVIYVCGDAKNMLKDIRCAIVSCLVDVGELSSDDAENYIKEMEQTNRYVKDIWL